MLGHSKYSINVSSQYYYRWVVIVFVIAHCSPWWLFSQKYQQEHFFSNQQQIIRGVTACSLGVCNMSDAFSKKLGIFATLLCHVCCNWIATKLYSAGETQWVYIHFQTGLMKCAIGSNWVTGQLRVKQRKDIRGCMEATDCRAGRDFRNNLIQPPRFTDKESDYQGGEGSYLGSHSWQ